MKTFGLAALALTLGTGAVVGGAVASPLTDLLGIGPGAVAADDGVPDGVVVGPAACPVDRYHAYAAPGETPDNLAPRAAAVLLPLAVGQSVGVTEGVKRVGQQGRDTLYEVAFVVYGGNGGEIASFGTATLLSDACAPGIAAVRVIGHDLSPVAGGTGAR